MSDTSKNVGEQVRYLLQDHRPDGWIDYVHFHSLDAAVERLKVLKLERPKRTFRCISRTTIDREIKS